MKWMINFDRRRGLDCGIDREVASHLEEGTADLMDSGMPEQEAREKASREFGNVRIYTQDSREVWRWVWLETLLQDLRYGARMLRRNPGFTLVAESCAGLDVAPATGTRNRWAPRGSVERMVLRQGFILATAGLARPWGWRPALPPKRP